MRGLLLLLFTFLCMPSVAQSVNANVVRLAPSTVPSICNNGDLRIDHADNNNLKICKSNVWVYVVDAGTFTNPMTTNGDLITQAAGVPARVALGAANTVMTSSGSAVGWAKLLNANIDTAAAITYGKLLLTGSIVNADIGPAAAIAYGKLNLLGSIVNADIGASAGIVDTKLATISSSGKVLNSATTATSANTNSAIVARDGSGNFSAGTITASLTGAVTGNASTATALAANPSDCSATNFATAIDASGNLTCAIPAINSTSGILTVAKGGTGQDFSGSTGVLKDAAGTMSVATIVDADISSSAAITRSKLATGTINQVVTNDGSGNLTSSATLPAANFPAITGDVSSPGGSLTTTLATVNANVGTFGSSSLIPVIAINGKGLITSASTVSVVATAADNMLSKSANYTAVAGDFIKATSASFTVTLPTAVGISGQQIGVQHAGTPLTQVYTIHTTSSQTILHAGTTYTNADINTNGLFALYTPETFIFESDGSNWLVKAHTVNSNAFSGGAVAFSSTAAYTFTISSATVVAGDTYTNNSKTFTVTTSGTVTSMPASGTGAPAVSGTLTRASGTGPATLTFSAVSTSAPAFGTSTVNAITVSRSGIYAKVRFEVVESATTGAQNGSGDFIWFLPSGLSADTTIVTPYTGSVGAVMPNAPAASVAVIPATGAVTNSTVSSVYHCGYLYSSTSVRIVVTSAFSSIQQIGSGFFAPASAISSYNVELTFPALGFLP